MENTEYPKEYPRSEDIPSEELEDEDLAVVETGDRTYLVLTREQWNERTKSSQE
jgi:hypothetical protein